MKSWGFFFFMGDLTLVRGISVFIENKIDGGQLKNEILGQEREDGTHHPKEGKGHK